MQHTKKQTLSTNFFPVRKHEIVEVIIPVGTTKTRFNLPDLQNLRNVKLNAVEILSANDMTISPTQNPVVTNLELGRAYLTLQGYNGVEFLHQNPLTTLHYTQGTLIAGQFTQVHQYQKQFTSQRVNYPKSYIEYFPLVVPVATFSFLISIYYTDMTMEEINGANTFKNKS